MTVETQSLNTSEEVLNNQNSENIVSGEFHKINLFLNKAELYELMNNYSTVQNFIKNEYSYLNMEEKSSLDLIDSVSLDIAVRFRKNKDSVEPVFVNGFNCENSNYSLVINIKCSQQLAPEGEFNIRLTSSDIINEGIDLIEFIMKKILSVKNSDELLKNENSKKINKQLEQVIEEQGLVSFFTENVIDKLDVYDFDSIIDSEYSEYNSISKLSAFLIKNYTISNTLFINFINALSKKNIVLLENYSVYEDYIKNNEHIFWNVEQDNDLVFKLFETNHIKSLLIERYKNSLNLKALESEAKDIHDYVMSNNKTKISQYLNNLSELVSNHYGLNEYSEKMTLMMNNEGNENEYLYNSKGFVIVSNEILDKMIIKILMDNSFDLKEYTIEWLYNYCNKDVKSCKYESFSLKENIDLLMAVIENKNCPDKILSGYFLMGGIVAKKIILSPKLDNNEILVKQLYMYLKRELDKKLDDEILLDMYKDMKKFPFLNQNDIHGLDDSLIAYVERIRISVDYNYLKNTWVEIFNYKENDISWKYSFSIKGKRTELLTLIINNMNCPVELLNEYRMIFGSSNDEYQVSMKKRLSEEVSEEVFFQLFKNLNIEGKIELLVDRLNNSVQSEFIEKVYQETIINTMNDLLIKENSLSHIMRITKVISCDVLFDTYNTVIENCTHLITDNMYRFLKERSAISTNTIELETIKMILNNSISDKKYWLITRAVSNLDKVLKQEIQNLILNNKVNSVNSLQFFIDNPNSKIINFDNIRNVIEREIEQLKFDRINFNSNDFQNSARNIRILFLLNTEQLIDVWDDLNKIKKEILKNVIDKYVKFIEESDDEYKIYESAKFVFEINSMESIINVDKLNIEVFPNVFAKKKDVEPYVEALMRNKYTPLSLKMNLRTTFWGDVNNSPMIISM